MSPDPVVLRAELVLSGPDSRPLRHAGLRPDPLTPIVRAFGELRDELDEQAEVVVDLLPLTPARRARRRKAVLGGGGRTPASGRVGSVLNELNGGQPLQLPEWLWPSHQGRPPARATDALQASNNRAHHKATLEKWTANEAMFESQVLIRVQSQSQARAEGHLHALLAGFQVFAGENHWKVHGWNFGFWFLGADSRWRWRSFDHRIETGLFRPPQRAVVSASEMVAFFKPPTAHCSADNVVRSAGVFPPPPRSLPAFALKRADLMPLGYVESYSGPRPVGVPLADTLFSIAFGRSGFGKTETALTRFIHLARSGHGAMYLDPHVDALDRAKPYLTQEAHRIIELDLTPRGSDVTSPGWNIFDMRGCTVDDIEAKTNAVADSFASALQWGETNNRAITLTTMAARAMCELAFQVPPKLTPTLFQMSTILSDEEWRRAVLPHLSKTTQQFFRTRFARLSDEAITPVTNMIDRLRTSSTVAALLGSSVSTINFRRAMDEGKIIMVCPTGSGDKETRLLANFIIYDVLRAAKSRRTVDPDKRRIFHVFLDELQTVDGASKGNLAAILRETRKYGLRMHAMTQQPGSLTATTLSTFLDNSSHTFSFTLGADSARLVARQWQDAVSAETISELEKYTFGAAVTVDGQISKPFLVRGFSVEELFGDLHVDNASEVIAAASKAKQRTIKAVLADLEDLDDRIVDHLDRRSNGAAFVEEPRKTGNRGLRAVGD